MELSWEKVSARLQPARAGHARLALSAQLCTIFDRTWKVLDFWAIYNWTCVCISMNQINVFNVATAGYLDILWFALGEASAAVTAIPPRSKFGLHISNHPSLTPSAFLIPPWKEITSSSLQVWGSETLPTAFGYPKLQSLFRLQTTVQGTNGPISVENILIARPSKAWHKKAL